MEEKDYWIGFSVFPGVGPVLFHQLLETFSSAQKAWYATEVEIKPILKEKKTKDFLIFREQFDGAEYAYRLDQALVTVITLSDAAYPSSLKEIDKPPFVLYVKGNLGDGNSKRIAIVGTRKITQYGHQVTDLFSKALVQAGCTIVSGLALGVDALAHTTTVENSGKTIAVLGCGVDCCYPRENQQIYDAILASGGAIISEIPLGQPATMGTFPARNRIVAGLSDGILVTEGAGDSGSLITAEFGLRFGKKVFAIPGPITSQLSKGPYKLIEKGAVLVTDPEQIVREIGINERSIKSTKGTKNIKGDTKEEQLIIDLLNHESLSFDEMVRALQVDSARLGSLLSLMEIKGMIKTENNTISIQI